ncbi:hypothetical protein AK830_g10886 [Neonectria ditissima]|uniref:F-box domain-containing protein n=1 Tax=Neonectria ditissima TaxID=78410 RepID=A0A0P7B688_9HYPO|nr:hypothetical protein AK830_g10886 [Neonectria ditissima]
MPSPQAFSEEAIAKVTRTDEDALDGMIRDIRPALYTRIRRVSSNSSIGKLDTLPTELLLFTLNLLDFQSWSRFSQVSLRGKETIESLPPYTDVMKYAPETLTALGKTRLLQHHSALLLQQTLRSDKCASCLDLGFFLFLVTCERVCYGCLMRNQALWVTTPNTIKKCFHLTDEHLKRLPVMYSIPGVYHVWFRVSRNRVYRLVSVKQAIKLAIEIHGGIENVKDLLPPINDESLTMKRFAIFKYFHETPLEPPGVDMSTLPPGSSDDVVWNEFCGVASMRFPVVSGTVADRGCLCQGCEVVCKDHDRKRIPDNVISALVPPEASAQRVLSARAFRLHSRDGFLEHIKNCYGARKILDN